MVFRNFRMQCSFRIVLLTATIIVFSYLIIKNELFPLVIFIGFLILLETYYLIHYIEKTNVDLGRFLDAVKYEDFSQTFTGAGIGTSFNDLIKSFNEVLLKFQKTRAEKEEHFRYLQTVVQHVGIGLIAFKENGDVELINKAAKSILRVVHLKNIKSLEGCSKELVTALFNLRSGQRTLLKVQLNGDLSQLVLQATEFILHEQKYTLVSIQNIQSELEEKEIESWHRLIRVLTHEIMNSVTPISSLASTASDMLIKNSTGNGSKGLDPVIIEDVRCAVKTIENRSQGLLHFVESYRKLLRIPKPQFKIFTVESLFQRVEQLLSPQLTAQKIKINRKVEPETLELTADPEQIEQVLINLILNSKQALAGKQDPRIEILANQDKRGRIILSVIDNGVGIPKEVHDKIFVPFFTTKKNGTGIGLSLSQQIMRLHRGTISVQSKPDEQTVVSLKF